MIHVTIRTKKIYSYDAMGMPKFETIDTTLEDGAQFNKFIKYLPYQNYIPSDLEIVKVVKDKEEIDKTDWQKVLNSAIGGMTKVEPTIEEKYNSEKARNDELLERLAKLEAMLEPKNQLIESIEPKIEIKLSELDQLREEYQEKVGKRPYHGWDIETLKQKINGN